MACLREKALDGRLGTVPCNEEGCVFGSIETDGRTVSISKTSAFDCVLQSRLRAGDSENPSELGFEPEPEWPIKVRGVLSDPWGGPHTATVEIALTEKQYNAIRDSTAAVELDPDYVVRLAGEELDVRTVPEVDHTSIGPIDASGEIFYKSTMGEGRGLDFYDDFDTQRNYHEWKPDPERPIEEFDPKFREKGQLGYLVLGHDAGKSALRRQVDEFFWKRANPDNARESWVRRVLRESKEREGQNDGWSVGILPLEEWQKRAWDNGASRTIIAEHLKWHTDKGDVVCDCSAESMSEQPVLPVLPDRIWGHGVVKRGDETVEVQFELTEAQYELLRDHSQKFSVDVRLDQF